MDHLIDSKNPDSVRSSFRLRFGENLAPDSLDDMLACSHEAEAICEFLYILSPELLDELGILEWAYCNAPSDERADALGKTLKEAYGKEQFYILQAACLFVTQMQSSSDFAKIAAAREFFSTYRHLHLSPFQFRGCTTVQQMEEVLSLHQRLAGGDLSGFYDEGVSVVDLKGYSVRARKGMWEATGGTSLLMCDSGGELVAVSGYFHWIQFKPETTIVSIQGSRGRYAAQQNAYQALGIHPANLVLLLFLQLSRLFGQRMVRIRSSASPDYNVQEEDSTFYRIPRNHFRVKADNRTGLYEFDAARRDRILNKFAKRHTVVAECFASLAAHLRT